MSSSKLSFIPTVKLNETYQILYELQQKLGMSDEYLLNTNKCPTSDTFNRASLKHLLEAYKEARENLITWYLKQTLVEINATISLLTAKMKFIEYKLGLCDGLDLHQACSLSLVDFCNILSDMAEKNNKNRGGCKNIKELPTEAKTLKQISAELGLPEWLSQYRNQICHVPSESPCISILIPLVAKSLDYMRDSFWSKVMEHESFDEQKFKKLLKFISKLTYVTSFNKRLHLKKGVNLSKKRKALAEQDLIKYSRRCLTLRRMIVQNPRQSLDILARFVTLTKFQDKSKNSCLIVEQIIFAKQLEAFIFMLVTLVRENPRSGAKYSWLRQMIRLIGLRKDSILRETLNQMELSASNQIMNLTNVPAIKCCQLVYRLANLDTHHSKRLIISLRHRLLPILGKEKTLLLIKMSKIMKEVKE